jgi:RNA polymerase III RPC4
MAPPVPPPSQAGKFKPRKPAKRISVVIGAGAVPDAAPSSSSLVAAAGGHGSRAGRGSGGRGRDGGRGSSSSSSSRAPMPQGKAFFTAQPAPAAAASSRQRRSAGAAAETTTQQQQQEQQQQRAGRQQPGTAGRGSVLREGMTEEEIVGTLDEAVGSNVPATVKIDSTFSKGDTAQSAFERALMGGEDNVFAGHNQGPDGYLYDSDSSRDEDDAKSHWRSNKRRETTHQQQLPLTLPFPPVGGVDDSRGALYPLQNDTSVQRQLKPQHSPFLVPDAKNKNKAALEAERDSWFLVQWPTRLPPIQQQHAAPKSKDDNMVVDDEAAAGDAAVGKGTTTHEETAMVATAPVQLNAFDNVLTNAVPGRVGKLKIYKSGKSVLVLEGPDGAPAVRPSVHDGAFRSHTCRGSHYSHADTLVVCAFVSIYRSK